MRDRVAIVTLWHTQACRREGSRLKLVVDPAAARQQIGGVNLRILWTRDTTVRDRVALATLWRTQASRREGSRLKLVVDPAAQT